MKLKKVALTAGLTFAFFFLFAFFWGYIQPTNNLRNFHLQLMQLYYPGFSLDFKGFFIGIVEAFVYGYVIGAFFMFIYKKVK